ncbi:pyrroline-5-carboxylate reductase [Gehongia tenuis]|uniref:Pyrroline-5-carboxylate reductase n=1 Tax=Gehongia tenuis TaxID=2763655 RepID=A0A926D2H8_9FIRM|nr:pyrroline-5-carboxylate reductase [Gehongia tenuis]MBC8531205.1 pyrroline-5-carboxylate reductase [Gehongia tenuis]
MARIGFIGAGNMAEAIIRGILGNRLYAGHEILVYDANPQRMDYMVETYKVVPAASNEEMAERAALLVLAVKPQVAPSVLPSVAPHIDGDQSIVSILAGWSLETLRGYFRKGSLVRVMPNMPALVGQGMSAISFEPSASEALKKTVLDIFAATGEVEVLPEHQLDAAGALSGSGPAYVACFMEALADAGVREGLPRATAYRLAAQTLKGTAAVQLETGKLPAEIKDMVCSPGGTSIVGVYELERGRMRAAVIDAVHGAVLRTKEL